MSTPRLCTFGGLKADDLYIERSADRELQAALRRGEYAYVLSARQTGKTSLLLHTMRALRSEGARCAKIDLGAFGSDASPDAFYESVAVEIADALGIDDAVVSACFKRWDRLTPVRRFLHFLRDTAAANDAPLLVFIDEIEGFLKLPMHVADDFLSALRTLYNDRGREPVYRRLSFCLMGVCTPGELIRDERRTPFNVARSITLTDFTWPELRDGFLPVLAPQPQAEAILERVFFFTSGHPYLSHRLIQDLVDQTISSDPATGTPAAVDAIVQRQFLSSLGREQENFLEVERRLCLGSAHRVRQRVAVYRAIRAGQRVVVRGRDPIQLELNLSGLVRAEPDPDGEANLVVRNRIFAQLFDASWAPKSDPAKLDPGVWIQQQTEHWQSFERNDAFVLRGEELYEAQGWATAQRAIEPSTRDFLAASERVDRHERAVRLYALLWTVLWSSFANFLLAATLPRYFQERGYGWPALCSLLYGLPFALAPLSGWLADRLRIAPASMLTSGLAVITTGCACLLADALLPVRGLAWLALPLVLLGQILQRPHIAVLVGLLYPRSDHRLELTYVAYYFFVNLGALLGPLLGDAELHRHGWLGVLSTLAVGSVGALYSFTAARSVFQPLNLPLRHEPYEAPQDIRQRQKTLLLLVGAMWIFWSAFYAIGDHLQAQVAMHVVIPGPAMLGVLLQGLSSEAITPLFVLTLAPLLAGLLLLARRLHREPSAPAKISAGLAILLLVLWLSMRSHAQSLFLVLSLLTLAELLIVPASMAMTSALSPAPRLSAMMGGYFLVMGTGSWTAQLLMQGSSMLHLWLAIVGLCSLLFAWRRHAWARLFPRPGERLPPPTR
jgi:dipeptide/tripeptide permease